MNRKSGKANYETLQVIAIILGFITFVMFIIAGSKLGDYMSYKKHQYEKVYNAKYFTGSCTLDDIDVQGYSHVYEVYNTYSEDDALDLEETFRNLKVDKYDEESLEIDVYDVVIDFLENKDDFYYYFKENNTFELDENRTLVLKHFSAEIDQKEGVVLSYFIEGFLLEK